MRKILNPDQEWCNEFYNLAFYWRFKVLTPEEDKRRMEMVKQLEWPELREFLEANRMTFAI